MSLKTSTYLMFAIAAAASLVMVNSVGAQAFAYGHKDRDHDDHKDLKQTIYCIKHHGGGDVSAHYYNKCGERYLEGV